MSQVTFTLAYLATNVFLFYTMHRLYSLVFSGYQYNWKIRLAAFTVAFAINSTVFLTIHVVAVTLAMNIILFTALTFLFKGKLVKRLLIGFAGYALFAILETLVVMVFKALGYDVFNNQVYQVLVMAIQPLFVYITASIIIQNLAIKELSFLRFRHMAFMIVITAIIFAFAYALPYFSEESTIFMLIGVIALALVTIFLFTFMDALVKTTKERAARTAFEIQNKLFQNEIDIVKGYQREIKAIKHNIDYHIQTIHGLIEKGEYEKSKTYISGITELVKLRHTPVNTGIPELDSILNHKINQAIQAGIKVNSTIKIEDQCNIEPQAYISIIGNLMTNAIEACSLIVEEEKKNIQLTLGIIKGVFIFELDNPYIEPLKIINGEYITTKSNVQDHGFGIAHVKNIVNGLGGDFSIDTYKKDNARFCTKVMLYNN